MVSFPVVLLVFQQAAQPLSQSIPAVGWMRHTAMKTKAALEYMYCFIVLEIPASVLHKDWWGEMSLRAGH